MKKHAPITEAIPTMKLHAVQFPSLVAGAALLAMLVCPAYSATLSEALDAPPLIWQGTSLWEGVVTSSARDGVDAARINVTGDDGEQRLQTTVSGPGRLALWWQSTVRDDEGDIRLEVDGMEFMVTDGDEFPWRRLEVNVPAGTHTVAVKVSADHVNSFMVDQAVWLPGQRLPAAVAMGDPDGLWIQQGDWRQAVGESRDGTGDAAKLHHAGGAGQFRLQRKNTGPALVRYWVKSVVATPPFFTDPWLQIPTTEWTQRSRIESGVPGVAGISDFIWSAAPQSGPATIWIDDMQIIPLSLADALNLPAGSSEFTVSSPGRSWWISRDEADGLENGSVEVSPQAAFGSADIRATFNGEGLLTWSWRKWSDLDETLTVTVNGLSPQVYSDDNDYSINFTPAARLLNGAGSNSVLWHCQWGENGWNPIAIDSVLFSPPAAANIASALDLNAPMRLYGSAGAGWTSQNAVTHDGTDAVELNASGVSSRQALTMPVVGPGFLSWWWRSELPEGAKFRVDRQRGAEKTIGGATGWQQSFLELRAGEEFVRWEFVAGASTPVAGHKVWLDDVRVGQGFGFWTQLYQLAGPNAAPLADPDFDGSNNLIEYAFGSAPLDSRSASNPIIRHLPDGKIVLEYVRNPGRTDISIQAEMSRDLTHWEPVSGTVISMEGEWETVQAELPAGAGPGFIRAKVTQRP